MRRQKNGPKANRANDDDGDPRSRRCLTGSHLYPGFAACLTFLFFFFFPRPLPLTPAAYDGTIMIISPLPETSIGLDTLST